MAFGVTSKISKQGFCACIAFLLCAAGQSTSSTKKGETLEDSMRMFSAYSDAIVLRHPQKVRLCS